LVSLVAVITLALGIGANATAGSLVHSILLRPLPFADPDRLLSLSEYDLTQPDTPGPVSVPNFFDWRHNRSFEDLAAYYRWKSSLTGGGEPERLWTGLVSASFFDVLRVRPLVGRTFTAAEDSPGGEPVVVLSHGLWQRRYGGDTGGETGKATGAVGRSLILDGKPHTIVGVMPASFDFPNEAELWVPLAYGPDSEPRNFAFLNVVGRLRPGVSLAAARAEMSGLAQRLEREQAETNKGRGIQVKTLHERLVGNVRPALLMLLGVTALVLLVACTNLVNLLMARQVSRSHEDTVRAALGASRRQMMQQPLVEGLLLGLTGGAAGLLLSAGAVNLVARYGPQRVPRLAEAGLGARVLMATLALALLAGLLSALLPALRAARPDLAQRLNATSRGLGGGVAGSALRRILVVAEIALTLLLLIGAGLLLKSLTGLLRTDPGFDPSHVLTMQIELPEARYPEAHQPPAFYAELYRRLAALPGVESAGGIFLLPLSGMNATAPFTLEGEPEPGENDPKRVASLRPVGPDYFRAMGMRLVRGRRFTPGDSGPERPVAVINESMARRFWPGRDPVGRKATFGVDFGTTGAVPKVPWEIVGIVADDRHAGLDKDPSPALYVSQLQTSWREMTLVIRSSTLPESLAPAARRVVWSLDPDLPVSEIKTMDEWLAESVAQPRFYAMSVAGLAALALVLAMVGLYGIIAFSVGQRTHELGIRMALGARRTQILRLVINEALLLTIVGAAAGLAAAPLLTGLLGSLLYGVTPTDRTIFYGAPLVLLAVAMAASYLPARRAARLEPQRVLKPGQP
jgi:putative ABC transport system permease protein